MDCADLNKTSDVKREAMVSKLHNMQWLKSTLHSSNPGKVRTICKQMREHNENSQTENKVLLTKNDRVYLVEEPDCSIEKCEEYIPGTNIMSESNRNLCNKDPDVTDLPPNIEEVVHKKGERNTFGIVAEVKTEFYRGEKSKNTYAAQNETDDIARIATYANSDKELKQKADQDSEEINFIKHSDNNNNNNNPKFATLFVSEINIDEKTICKTIDVESSKTSMEAKDKNTQVKASSNESKTSIKKEEDAALFKINEKPSITDSRKSVSNSLKASTPVNKNAKTDRSNNKHVYARNIACIRREEFVKQRSVSKDRIENEKKDAVAKTNIWKTDAETELNKTIDAIPQNKNMNKSKALQKQQQQTVSKQFTSRTKSQEAFKKDTSASNDNNTLEKAENRVHASKSSELALNESEKKDQEVIAEKNSRNHQKANRGANVRRSATFVAQYRNSTFSKQNQNNGTLNKTEYTLTYGKNSSYARNNPRTDRDNVGRKNVQKDYISNSKFNRRTEERANGMENHVKRQNEAAALTCNRKGADPTKTETLLIEIKESANNSNVDHAEQKPTTTTGQSREETETTDVSKIDANQQDTVAIKKMIDKEINTPAHTSNNDKRTTESQTNVTHQNLKQENVQRATDNTKQLENNQSWCNVSSVMQRNNITNVNSQHSFQSMHFGMQQMCAQTGDLSRQMSPWIPDCNRYYEQHFATEDPMRLGHILNTSTFDAVPYENSLHTVSNDVAVSPSTLEIAIDRNRENSNALYRYTPHMHSRPVTSLSNFPNYSVSSGHGNRWNSTLQEGSVHMEHPAYNVTQQPAAMVYKSGMFGPDDFNAHATNCLPHPVVYTPCMQTWNPQLQYSVPVFYNSPYAGYAMFPDTMTQSAELDDNSSLQQPKYISHPHMNNYVRNGRNYDPIDCAAQARNSIDNVPMKSDQYYKRYHDNCRTAYDMPRHIPPVSHSRSQGMNFVPANAGQRNAHYSQSPRYYRQNVNNTQVPKKAHDQRIQDFICDENALEDIPPMISPKEFITSNINLPSKNDQFAASAFKPEFKMNPNADYRPPLWQRYNNFRRNTTCHDFSRDNGSPVISIGRGSYKGKKS